MEYKYETHVHTAEVSNCSRVPAAKQAKIYRDMGYAGIIITDHLNEMYLKINKSDLLIALKSWRQKMEFLLTGYEAAKAEGDRIGLDVFFGWEFNCDGMDLLTYGLGLEFLLTNKDIFDLPIEAYSRLVRANGGYLAQAHPYRKVLPLDPYLIDGVEVYNAVRAIKNPVENESVMTYAKFHNLPMQAGTDSHKENRPFYSGIILEKRAGSIFDIINAIKSNQAKLILPSNEKQFMNKSVKKKEENKMTINIIYDCSNATNAVRRLRDYLVNEKELEVICEKIDDKSKTDIMARDLKKIFIGHHSYIKDKLSVVENPKYYRYGITYGFTDHLCVLRASKSYLKPDTYFLKDSNKKERKEFYSQYRARYNEDPKDIDLRAAQFRYLVDEFIKNDLDSFLER